MTTKFISDLILSGAFELYGQPKWTFGKNTCNTYEVFAEVVHLPGGAEIPAQLLLELIKRDEKLTMIFSQWFLDAAVESAAALCQKTNSHVTLSIDLLPQYASQELFVDRVVALLERTGFNPKKLQFDLSEAQSLSVKGIENLNRLHDELGVGLYLANFGKGYANVDLLRDVHFDGSELDRSFAVGIPDNDQAELMVFAIQNFAHALNLQVCAKGIETPEQFEFFEELKCFKGQGFIIGKPLPMSELEEYIGMYAIHAEED